MISAINMQIRTAYEKVNQTRLEVPQVEAQRNAKPIILLPLLRNWGAIDAYNSKASENDVRQVEEISRAHPP